MSAVARVAHSLPAPLIEGTTFMHDSRTGTAAHGSEEAAQAAAMGVHTDDLVDRLPEEQTFVLRFRIDDVGNLTLVGLPQTVSSRMVTLPPEEGCDGHFFFERRTVEGVLPAGYPTDSLARFYYGRSRPMEGRSRERYPFGAVVLRDERVIALRKGDRVCA